MATVTLSILSFLGQPGRKTELENCEVRPSDRITLQYV